jgi:hypothetical protein
LLSLNQEGPNLTAHNKLALGWTALLSACEAAKALAAQLSSAGPERIHFKAEYLELEKPRTELMAFQELKFLYLHPYSTDQSVNLQHV